MVWVLGRLKLNDGIREPMDNDLASGLMDCDLVDLRDRDRLGRDPGADVLSGCYLTDGWIQNSLHNDLQTVRHFVYQLIRFFRTAQRKKAKHDPQHKHPSHKSLQSRSIKCKTPKKSILIFDRRVGKE
jgi:hypothetical protein